MQNSPEDNLVRFNEYVKKFRRWMEFMDMGGWADERKWAMLAMVGGPQMDKLIEYHGKVNVIRQAGRQEIRANPTANPPVLGQPAVEALVPDTWEVGIKKIRDAITASTNPAMAKLQLFYKSPQGDMSVDDWAYELCKIAKRVDWPSQTEDQAVLDAIMFQTSSDKWREKILAERYTLEEALNYGRVYVFTKEASKMVKRPPRLSTRTSHIERNRWTESTPTLTTSGRGEEEAKARQRTSARTAICCTRAGNAQPPKRHVSNAARKAISDTPRPARAPRRTKGTRARRRKRKRRRRKVEKERRRRREWHGYRYQ